MYFVSGHFSLIGPNTFLLMLRLFSEATGGFCLYEGSGVLRAGTGGTRSTAVLRTVPQTKSPSFQVSCQNPLGKTLASACNDEPGALWRTASWQVPLPGVTPAPHLTALRQT